MDDTANFHRLKYEQEKILQDNQDAQKTREKLKEDYLKLHNKLQTLPDVISEDAMVPVGNVAFFPGHLIHTNEIMVLLGDNWFVERSAKQAIEIIERRIKMVEKQLSDLQKEETRIKDQKKYTDEFLNVKEEAGEIKEIQEELPDEPAPRRKGTSRKAHVPKHNQVPRSVTFKDADHLVQDISKDVSKNNSETIDHDELFARLNELEREEQEQEEKMHAEQMKKIYNGEYVNDSTKNETIDAPYTEDMESNRRHVKFKTSKCYESDDEPMSSRNIIKFSHTPPTQRERSASESDLRNTINSPADVFEQFAARVLHESGEKPLKSILKKDSRSNSNENLKLRPILKTSPEHQPGTPELSFDDPRPILKTPPDSQGSDRRPGTPEYILADDPKPILKSNNGNISQGVQSIDIDANDQKSILKSADTQLENYAEMFCDMNGDETRSILKLSSGESSSPERAISLEDIPGGSRLENRRPILKSPDNLRSTKMSTEPLERRPILKNTNNDGVPDRPTVDDSPSVEAIADQVVERNARAPDNENSTKTSSTRRPMSKFKAARAGK